VAFVFSLVTFVTMDELKFSFIIPVYNRPNEIKELLESFLKLEGDLPFEIVIVEDGSTDTSEKVISDFNTALNISYFYKANSGPGDSRNFGMQRAKGNYYIILDSDVILPSSYLITVKTFLEERYYHCFGGPDAAHPSFSTFQKAINFAMTSFLTTGGIRGANEQLEDFQPRSFNMGISKEAFHKSGGFGKIHPGEDPDLSLRLIKLGYKTTLIKHAFVYHKRRISWMKFYKQVYKFGLVRPILSIWHPDSKKVLYWLPTLFSIGLCLALALLFFSLYWPMVCYGLYYVLVFVLATVSAQSISVGLQSMVAITIQFFGYGYGFLKSTLQIGVLKKDPEREFPQLFFN
jgi:glycosyltransferase involved in cell wall biosynthesis